MQIDVDRLFRLAGALETVVDESCPNYTASFPYPEDLKARFDQHQAVAGLGQDPALGPHFCYCNGCLTYLAIGKLLAASMRLLAEFHNNGDVPVCVPKSNGGSLNKS